MSIKKLLIAYFASHRICEQQCKYNKMSKNFLFRLCHNTKLQSNDKNITDQWLIALNLKGDIYRNFQENTLLGILALNWHRQKFKNCPPSILFLFTSLRYPDLRFNLTNKWENLRNSYMGLLQSKWMTLCLKHFFFFSFVKDNCFF